MLNAITLEHRPARRAVGRAAILLASLLATATATAAAVLPSGGGGFEMASSESCLSAQERARILSMLDANKAHLIELGLLSPADPAAKGGVSLSWPLRLAAGLTDPSYYGTSNFVDLDPSFPDSLLDYNCGERTYDTSAGYNHRGIDYFTWPFRWYKMDNNQVEVVAAEPGTLIGKSDGNFDRSCSLSGGSWNAAYVMHADGSVAWYGHFKNGTVTSKSVGSAIAAGEYLGVVGSSGNSTGPHLHFEIYDDLGEIVEPHSGPCQGQPSWWEDQRPYYDSAINLISTHDEPPVFPSCPTTESPNFANDFDSAATVHVALYYRDILAGQVSDLKMIMPDGNVWQEWQHSIATPAHYSAAYWYWTWFMPPAPLGVWTFEATYDGVVYSHRFTMGTGIFADGFESGDTSSW